MKRGDVVTVAATGDYDKPRPAVIVQTDAFPESHASIVICQMTSVLSNAPDFRITIDPNAANGLRVRSQVMVDKPTSVRRERIGQSIGRLGAEDIGRLNIALAFVMGLADCRHAPKSYAGTIADQRGHARTAKNPPSIGSITPVTHRASSLARYTAAYATSHPVPSVCNGTAWRRRSRPASPKCATIGVATVPTTRQFARIPSAA